MTTLTMQLPEDVFAAVRSGPIDFLKEMRLAAAAKWYSSGLVSQEIAAEVAGLDRTDFLLALARMGQDSFVVDLDELKKEIGYEG
jgi:predicted HTH domain antitoxin